MKVDFKDNKNIFLEVSFDNLNNYFTVNALSCDNVVLGFITFSIKQGCFCKKIWINKIETVEEHREKGVGSKLINYLENFAKENRIGYIEGKFFPSNASAKNFYEHRGYSIEQDGYEKFVCKSISQNEKKKENKNEDVNEDLALEQDFQEQSL